MCLALPRRGTVDSSEIGAAEGSSSNLTPKIYIFSDLVNSGPEFIFHQHGEECGSKSILVSTEKAKDNFWMFWVWLIREFSPLLMVSFCSQTEVLTATLMVSTTLSRARLQGTACTYSMTTFIHCLGPHMTERGGMNLFSPSNIARNENLQDSEEESQGSPARESCGRRTGQVNRCRVLIDWPLHKVRRFTDNDHERARFFFTSHSKGG